MFWWGSHRDGSLELKVAAADRAAGTAQQSLDAAHDAHQLVNAAAEAERKFRWQEEGRASRQTLGEDAEQEKAANSELPRCDLLERALDVRLADKRVLEARAAVQKKSTVQTTPPCGSRGASDADREAHCHEIASARSHSAHARLAHGLAAARGALNVGLAVAIEPHKRPEIVGARIA